MPYKIVIKGGYGLTNFGDDALMYVLASKLRPYFKDDEVAFACYDNEYNQKLSHGFCIEPVQYFKAIETDLLLFGGGTQFYSFLPERSKTRKILSMLKQFLKSPKGFMFSRQSVGYKHMAAIGIGVGPFLENADLTPEINAKQLFSEMSYIAVRDTESYKEMCKWNLSEAKLYSDICYLSDVKISNKRTSIQRIGIIVRDWIHTIEGRAYYDKIIPLVGELEKKGYEVTLIMFAKQPDAYWNSKKSDFIRVLEWNPDSATIEEFIEQLTSFDLFVTARYHGAVFAGLLNIPFVSIVVEQKLALISDTYKDCSKKWEYPFNTDDCLNSISEIDTNYIATQKQIYQTTQLQKEKANQMFSNFLDFCKSIHISKVDK